MESFCLGLTEKFKKSGKHTGDESYSISANMNLGSELSSIFSCAVSYEVFEHHHA